MPREPADERVATALEQTADTLNLISMQLERILGVLEKPPVVVEQLKAVALRGVSTEPQVREELVDEK